MALSEYRKQETFCPLWAAAGVSISLLGMTAGFWELIDILTPFIFPLILMGVLVIFWATLAWSLVHVLRKKRYKKTFAFFPLGMQLLALLIIMTVPFSSIMLDLDFKRHLKEREKVVSRVISGELKPNVAHNTSLILLPDDQKYLSKGGGEIMVEKHSGETSVFFFMFRGVLDNFSGFMYRSDDSNPQRDDFDGDFFEIKRINENWYWAASGDGSD
ncbi:MAG: hypothetical protein Q3M24_00860 [Candidatus Electrothrix aestuarii]|uniref:Uncharacterized protein n=1 Tax=Candidatus Electrothrix aestuarii TaxID=3062594 RepID=A0AAU8LVV7_9BACT|nr:hypothetical protein [Candidatus Electrothrix aestuarii]